jgi:hypothetical protein
MKTAGYLHVERRRWGMAAMAYRVQSIVSSEMPNGMVPVKALFVNILITKPHDANAGETQT